MNSYLNIICKQCKKNKVEDNSKGGFVNQPKDVCFDCWFKQDIVSDEIKPFFTNKEIRKILLVFGSVLGITGFLFGYFIGVG